MKEKLNSNAKVNPYAQENEIEVHKGTRMRTIATVCILIRTEHNVNKTRKPS